jgi:hypothetical protein
MAPTRLVGDQAPHPREPSVGVQRSPDVKAHDVRKGRQGGNPSRIRKEVFTDEQTTLKRASIGSGSEAGFYR